jgi:beta/gamma crystallin
MRNIHLLSFARACAVAAATLGLASSAAAQGRGITVFADIDYSGASQTFRGDIPDLRQVGLNDTISSLQIPNGEVWQICEDINYQGRCRNVSGDVADLRAMNFNDRVSSMRRVSGGGFFSRNRRNGGYNNPYATNPYVGTSGTLGQSGLVFYDRPNFRGGAVGTNGGSNMVISANRGSVRVNGGTWRLCDTRGQCATVSSDVANLNQLGLEDRIVSVQPMNNNWRRYR